MSFASLKEALISYGASVVGFGDVRPVLSPDIAHLECAICIGLNRNLNETTVALLSAIQKKASLWLRAKGYRYLSIPPDSDRKKGKFISRLYPLLCHKTAATCSGLGWIGRNGLVINPTFGPKMSWATVLTDAPLPVDAPIGFERCGECRLCVEHCPSGALTGARWDVRKPFAGLIDLDKCRSHKNSSRRVNDKPNCGLCINICPYGRKGVLSGGVTG